MSGFARLFAQGASGRAAAVSGATRFVRYIAAEARSSVLSGGLQVAMRCWCIKELANEI